MSDVIKMSRVCLRFKFFQPARKKLVGQVNIGNTDRIDVGLSAAAAFRCLNKLSQKSDVRNVRNEKFSSELV